MRALDWSRSPLGLPRHWDNELRTLVGVMLGSQQPMFVVWGEEQVILYNDGYAPMCGARHPAALGGFFKDLWFDIWDDVEPILSKAYAGQGTQMDDISFVMHRNGYPEETHFAFSYTPVRGEAGDVLGMFCACTETTEQVFARRAQSRERERLYKTFELAPSAFALLEGPDHVFELTNAAYDRLTGHREVIGKPLREALPEIARQGFIDILNRVFRSGEPFVGSGIAIDLQRRPGERLERRILDFVYQPVLDDHQRVSGILVQAVDVTERKAADEHQAMLNHELGHRMKNQLAMVQAIVSQTLRGATDNEAARKNLSERIAVLGRAHEMLLDGSAERTNLRGIVDSVLELHDGDENERRFDVSGPDMHIASRPALSLSLILHELATNALKYGALSVSEGKVLIAWKVEQRDGQPYFVLHWRETGGPAVSEPERSGAGSRLIRAGLSGTVGSNVDLIFAPAGVECRIAAELNSFQRE